MAVGDLVTGDYMFEFNGLVIGATTNYDLIKVTDLLGHQVRSTTVDRFGRRGGSSGRHYANTKFPTFEGMFRSSSDTELETQRRALAAAFAVVTDPDGKQPLVFQLPGAGATKVQANVRCSAFVCELNRAHAIKYGPYLVRFEMPDPVLYSLALTSQVFTVPTDTRTLNNGGNAPAIWTATLIGPATNPTITHNGTGQSLQFTNLTLTGSDTLIYDSGDSTVKLNGTTVANSLASGFSWFDLDPGDNSISFTASNAGSASFSVSFRDAYWSN